MFHAKFGVNYTPYRLQCRKADKRPEHQGRTLSTLFHLHPPTSGTALCASLRSTHCTSAPSGPLSPFLKDSLTSRTRTYVLTAWLVDTPLPPARAHTTAGSAASSTTPPSISSLLLLPLSTPPQVIRCQTP